MFDFSNLPVPLWLWILSQVVGLGVLILTIIGFQMKRKAWLLAFLAAANALSATMQALLTNFVMAGLAAIVVVRLLVYAWLQAKRKKVPLWLDISIVVFFLAANVPVTLFTARWWFDWLFFGFVTIATFAQWLSNSHAVRISPVPVIAMTLVAAFFYSNPISIITESLALISVAIFYGRFLFSKKVRQNKCRHLGCVKEVYDPQPSKAIT